MTDTSYLIDELKRLYASLLQKRYEWRIDLPFRSPMIIRRHVEAFQLYRPYVDGGRVLDWGCGQAVDSCLLRLTLGNVVDLHGCDVGEMRYEAFHDFASLTYRLLEHPYRLPYADEEFDAVVASGVLEHVPNDAESLKEIYRILKPGGVFAITFLPNTYSWSEFAGRVVLRKNHHLRTYSRSEIRSRLLHSGFAVRKLGYHQLLPSLSSGNLKARFVARLVDMAHPLDELLSHVPVIRVLSANVLAVSQKVSELS